MLAQETVVVSRCTYDHIIMFFVKKYTANCDRYGVYKLEA